MTGPSRDAPLPGTPPIITPIQYNIPYRAVPEPATWAMMLLGFAAVGSMARRRRTGGEPVLARA